MRKAAVILILCSLFTAIAALFWYNEFIYSLPTPVPQNYVQVNSGEHIPLKSIKSDSLPVFLHFFNPDCPCSKFNIPHFRSLVKKYQRQVQFIVVVMSEDNSYTDEEIKAKFHIEVPILFDTSVARTCGVYATPQAVILNRNRQLFYRGNYNKSRYCTDKKTNYAEIALESMLHDNRSPEFNRFALQAYGCELPTCSKTAVN